MRSPVTVEQFLEIEEEERQLARLRAPAREVRRFHAAVRRFASAWGGGPARRITLERSKQAVALHFETDDRYGWVPVFSLKAGHAPSEFTLRGPFPERKKVRLSSAMRKSLDGLYKTWRGLPGAEEIGDTAVSVSLPDLADSGFDRFLETVLEAMAVKRS